MFAVCIFKGETTTSVSTPFFFSFFHFLLPISPELTLLMHIVRDEWVPFWAVSVLDMNARGADRKGFEGNGPNIGMRNIHYLLQFLGTAGRNLFLLDHPCMMETRLDNSIAEGIEQLFLLYSHNMHNCNCV